MAKQAVNEDMLPVLKKQLKEKKTERLYIFHGEETFLLQYYLQQMKKMLTDELTESFNYHKLTNEDFQVLLFGQIVENLPMMAESTFIWVDDIDIFKLPEADRSTLAQILSDIPPYCTVVFTYQTLQWKPDKRFAKLYSAVSAGMTVEFAKQQQRELIAWISRHFAAENKKIRPELCSYLIDITGGTMTVLAGEISKICAYSGSEEIVKSDIDAVTEPVLDAVSFQMTELLGQGNYGGALLKLQQLFKMQQEPLFILGSLGLHFRRLGVARTLHDSGKGYSELMQLCAMRDYAAKKTMSAARELSSGYCSRACALIMETDRAIKTSLDDPQRLLEVLVLRLAQEAKNG